MIESTTRNIPAILIAGLLVIALSLIFVCQDGKNGSAGFVRMFFQPKNTISMRITEEFSEAEIQAMREQLIPKKLVIRKNDSPGTLGETKTELTLSANQFLHHHHMKTGGTSVDGLIHCALGRLRAISLHANYSNIHECNEDVYRQCISSEESNACLQSVRGASILSYCAPLKNLDKPFGWNPHQLSMGVTVLRHPVARVWSMFRYQTKACYKCKNLVDIYKEIDEGKTNSTYWPQHTCLSQLLNHQTRNLLRNIENDNLEDSVDEAISNMKSIYTMIGLTDDMNTTAHLVQVVFPWLAQELDFHDAFEGDIDFSHFNTPGHKCVFPHENSSPRNNGCGKDGQSHWDLPDHPDSVTVKAIMEHNKADMILHDAAVRLFELQKLALNLV